MKAVTFRTKSPALANLHGPMAGSIPANGKMASKREKESILMNLDRSKKEYGPMASFFIEKEKLFIFIIMYNFCKLKRRSL